jgi:hypothetical protein
VDSAEEDGTESVASFASAQAGSYSFLWLDLMALLRYCAASRFLARAKAQRNFRLLPVDDRFDTSD